MARIFPIQPRRTIRLHLSHLLQRSSTMPEFVPKHDPKRRFRIPQLLIPFVLLIILSAFLLYNFPTPYNVVPSITGGPSLTVLTMLFGDTNTLIDADLVTHNCALISQSRHTFIIYTDNHTHTFCKTCACRTFTPVNCHTSCADPNKHGCNHCEKLLFIVDAVRTFGEFVFLDSDLIIVKDSFLDRLSVRTQAHDFLATYGFQGTAVQESPTAPLNSGVFFMRRLPQLNYSEMVDIMKDLNTNSDQSVITHFVRTHYTNWDSLSRQWNCRLSYMRRTNYPIEQCYTFHGRGDIDGLLGRVNKKLLHLN